MSTGRNGGPHADLDVDLDVDAVVDANWKRADFARPENVRHALVEIAGYAETALRANLENRRRIKSLAGELSERDAIIMQSLARLEDSGKVQRALLEGTAARVARLDSEKEIRHDIISRIRRSVESATVQLADLDKREAVGRARLDSAIEALEKRDSQLAEDVSHGNVRMVAETITTVRQALASNADLAKEARVATREETKESFARRHAVVMYLLGIVGAVILMIASAVIGAKLGHAPSVPTSLPAPPATGAHP